ncbi:NAD(P)-binding protein [Corynespora cassiicola Philippines]|uniref:NAD(P)-binding protein n=1 Tax=Corynespora cassiicola Philippines TaxID=1448308 RepID=A0A2T2PAL9_CORCC|nr:NAD(P)-binding protein [Corynespora cassiicola Philippines]
MVPITPKAQFNQEFDASSLKGRSVLITGGASGIGLASATTIAATGAFVTIADVQEEAGTAIAKDLASKGLKVQFIRCDVADYESQVAVFKSAIAFGGGKLDVVIPSAGVIGDVNLVTMATASEPNIDSSPPEPGFRAVDINLKAVYNTCFLAIHYFQLPRPEDDHFKKGIVLIGSVASYLGYKQNTTYSISKFGLRGLLYSIREAASNIGIRVNLVAPWFVKTPLISDAATAQLLALLGHTSVESVVGAIVKMSADQSIYGRAAMVKENGETVDLGDDLWDGYGGVETQKAVADPFLKASQKLSARHTAQ